jgi:hypothetical protein
MDAPLPDHAGHRARLRQRLIERGGDGLLDHELVEYLLALAIPRRDTKPLAKALLAEFGGLGGLFSADAEALMRVKGMGETTAAAIKIVQATALRLLQVEAKTQPVLASWQSLIDYLHADMAHRGQERVRVLHLNKCKQVVCALPSRAVYMARLVLSEKADDPLPTHLRTFSVGLACCDGAATHFRRHRTNCFLGVGDRANVSKGGPRRDRLLSHKVDHTCLQRAIGFSPPCSRRFRWAALSLSFATESNDRSPPSIAVPGSIPSPPRPKSDRQLSGGKADGC